MLHRRLLLKFRALMPAICFVISISSPAQRNFYFESIDAPGLLTMVTRAVATDATGHVYIGTNDGFFRYNGYVFTKYPVTGSDSLTCPIHNVRALHYDGKFIWVGGVEGLAKLDPSSNSFTYFKPDEKAVLGGHHPVVNGIVQIDNNLYLGTYQGFTILNIATGNRKEIPLPAGIKSRYTYGFCKDNNGRIWMGSSQDGIFIYDTGKGKLLSFKDVYGTIAQPASAALEILDARNGSFWIGSSEGLYAIETATGKTTAIDLTDGNGVKIKPEIRKIIRDENGNAYIATFGSGLFFYDAAGNGFTNYAYSDRWKRTLADNSITYIAKGNNGVYWITTEDAGLVKLNTWFSRYYFTPVPAFNKDKDNLNLTGATTMGNNTWFSSSAGLVRYDTSKKFTIYAPSAQGFPKDYSQYPTILNDNFLALLAYDDGVLTFNVKTGKFNYLQPPGKNITGNKMVFDWLSYVDTNQDLYMSTAEGGFFRCNYSKGTIDTLFTADNVKLDYPLVIPEPDRENMWIFASSNVYHYNLRDRRLSAIARDRDGNELPPVSFQEDVIARKNGVLYIASDEGFFIYDRNTNKLKRYTVADGLAENNCFSLFADANGQPYINYEGGLVRFNEQNNTFTIYPMPPLASITADFYFDKSDNLYIGAENSFIQVNKKDLVSYTGKPILQITQLHTGNKVVPVPPAGATMEIRHDDFPLIIDYELIDHLVPENNTVRYQLQGWDPGWITDNKRNFKAVYSRLNPGTYTFMIEGSNGLVKSNTLQLTIKIIPPFWQTWWFIALCVAGVGCGIYVLYRYRMNQMLKLQQVRNKIASDLHDDVGSTLSSISMYSEIVSGQVKDTHPQSTLLLDKISSNSREMIENMSDIVWMIKPGNDDFKNIENRMLNFANELCVPAAINFDFTADAAITGIKLPMQQRRDLYLIFKEAVNNAVKYSGCHSIHASIRQQNNSLEMRVSDDGNGFDPAAASQGNGLDNMQKRAAANNGQLTIRSSPGGGTEIVAAMPII